MRTAMIAMTTNSSIRVKPLRRISLPRLLEMKGIWNPVWECHPTKVLRKPLQNPPGKYPTRTPHSEGVTARGRIPHEYSVLRRNDRSLWNSVPALGLG